ncbi:replication protein [Candidatus Phytoplasma sacchari]|uniref:Replication protein n=1 Tax=Candidatus Phytoplasma sacchari TaxID=2609813 RepID=A0ABY7M0Z0_9MOLU|nr:replication protein [Candidatus Phytoplasma sacchari]
MENKRRIQYKNIFISYLDEKESFDEKDIKEFFINLIKIYDNKINYLMVGKKDKRFNILLILDKKPNFRNIEIFNLIIENKKSSKAMATLEPSIIKNAISPEDIYNKIISKNNKICEYGIPIFIRNISEKKRKEQDEDAHNYIKKLKKEFDIDLEMTTEGTMKILYEYLDETDNYWYIEKTSTLRQVEKTHFTRVKKLADLLNIRELKTFDLNDSQIKFIINHIKTQIQRLRDGHRAISLIIEGIKKIGKTDLIWSILKELNIVFNYMNKRINFSRKRYDDEIAEIDIWDDFRPGYFIEKDLFESTFGGQLGFTVETAKHEPDRDIFKRKLNIFICNPHNSFENFFNQHLSYKEYLDGENGDRTAIFLKLKNKLLFKVEEKEKGLQELAEEMFEKEKVEAISKRKRGRSRKAKEND